MAKQVIAETITPHFKAGGFYGGIDAGVQQLMQLVEGEPFLPPRASSDSGGDGAFVILIVGGIVAGWLLSFLMSRPAAGGIAALGSGAMDAAFRQGEFGCRRMWGGGFLRQCWWA